MPRGGYRPGAGRPNGTTKDKGKGVPAKAVAKGAAKRRPSPKPPSSIAQTVTSIVHDVMPCTAPVATETPQRPDTALGFLRAVWKREIEATDNEMRAAIAALPFTDPKIAEAGSKKNAALDAAKAAASSRFAPSAPPKLAVDNTKRPPG